MYKEQEIILGHCQFLNGLTIEEKIAVIENGCSTHKRSGDYFFHQGESSEIVYILLSGRIKLTQLTENGQEVIVDYFGPGAGLGIVVKTQEGVRIDMSLARQDLAQMAGTNVYQVSRIVSKWEQDYLIKTGRKRFTLLNAHGMVAIAEDLPEVTPYKH